MTLVQLEYVVAIDNFRNFSDAAAHCNVTQPTLSMQIQKIEQDLGVILFDRSKQPIYPTLIGEEVIRQARRVLEETTGIYNLVSSKKDVVEGCLHVGIIPTLSSNLLPMFVNSLLNKFSNIQLQVSEMKTEDLLRDLSKDKIEVAILVHDDKTPHNYNVFPLFYERFVVYFAKDHPLLSNDRIAVSTLKNSAYRIWYLEDGHCFKAQFFNFCGMHAECGTKQNQFRYHSGYIETLKRFVDTNPNTLTILPELSLQSLTEEEMSRVRYFESPEPVREVSLITRRNFLKRKLITALREEILRVVPEHFQKLGDRQIISL